MGLGILTIYRPKITITETGGVYSATMTTSDKLIRAQPAELVIWKVSAPPGFAHQVYIQFVDNSPAVGHGNPVDGPFNGLRRLDAVLYKLNAGKTVYLIPGGFLGQFTDTPFQYEVWLDDGSGDDKRLIDPEIIVDGDANNPLTLKKFPFLQKLAGKVQKLTTKKAAGARTAKAKGAKRQAKKTPKGKAKKR
jgi:hypothetical protein